MITRDNHSTTGQPSVAYRQPDAPLEDDDFLRSTYQVLLRAQQPNAAAIHAAFDALQAAHRRLQLAHSDHLASRAAGGRAPALSPKQ